MISIHPNYSEWVIFVCWNFMANLDIKCEFDVSRFNWETIEGYVGIVVKCVGDNMCSSSRYFRCELLIVGRCLSDVYFFCRRGYKNLYCWVDYRWFFVHYPSLLVEFNIFDCDYAQYILFIILDHIGYFALFCLFW